MLGKISRVEPVNLIGVGIVQVDAVNSVISRFVVAAADKSHQLKFGVA